MNTPNKKAHFFQHTECEYFPCHTVETPEDFNCLFCYCPLYALGERCGGNYSYLEKGIKGCDGCLFPHERSNYAAVIGRYTEITELARHPKPPPSCSG